MTEAVSKLQLRGDIFSILNKYNRKKVTPNKCLLKSDVEKLFKIQNKTYLARVLMEEIVSNDGIYAKYCAYFLLNVIEKNEIEKCCKKIFENKKIKDEKKASLIAILKQKGINFEQEEIDSYVEDADKLALNGIKNFLMNTMENPEAQIDLMDFYENISYSERLSLISNIKEECEENEYINAFSLLTYLDLEKDEKEIIQNSLLNSKSPYALEGLDNLLLKNSEDKKILKKINEIKFKFPNFEKDNFINGSKIYKTAISFIDGFENFSLIFSRIDENKQIDAFFTAINLKKGIISTMGFYKINQSNFLEVLSRLFVDSPMVEISESVLVSILDFYYQKNIKNNMTLPYEYNVWSKITKDIKRIEGDLSEFLNSELNHSNMISEKILKTFFNSKMIETWFYVSNQDEKIDKMLNSITETDFSSYKNLKAYIKNFVDKTLMLDNEFISLFKTRLLLESYILKSADFKNASEVMYSMCFNEVYIAEFLYYIMEKTIYFYFDSMLNMNDDEIRFNKDKNLNLNKKDISKIIKSIEKQWK